MLLRQKMLCQTATVNPNSPTIINQKTGSTSVLNLENGYMANSQPEFTSGTIGAASTGNVLLSSFVQRLGQACEGLLIYTQRQSQRRALAELDDYLLKDLGISRAAAMREASKPFWRE